MFHKPWQIWLAYLLILAVLVPGFGWLTLRILELDYQERLSRRTAEQEETVSLALWRMETVAMPIIAAEAARPYSVYVPYQQPPGSGESDRIPSPLFCCPSDFVNLNFQVNGDGTIFSPQCPAPSDFDWALKNGATTERLRASCEQLDKLQTGLSYETLLTQLPEELAELPTPPAQQQTPQQEEGQQALPPNPPQVGKQGKLIDNNNTLATPMQGLPKSKAAQEQSDFANRSAKLQSYAEQSAVQQRLNVDPQLFSPQVREGVSRPLWVGDKLLLARRVMVDGRQVIQGCWLDWARLQHDLTAELADIFPAAELRPVIGMQQAPVRRTLASLPVELVVPAITVPRFEGSPTQFALVIAWAGLVAACAAIAFLLYGVTSLSERRAAFVSAVTHELRTPLTTFQLYTEMLAGNMVGDERKRTEYVDTLYRESGRLSHLIDNVLAYSRLERRSARRHPESITVGSLLERTQPRLERRAQQGNMSLATSVSDEAAERKVLIEPTVIEQVLLNLVDNACKYAASAADRTIRLDVTNAPEVVELRVRDAGPGIGDDVRKRLFRPFSKSDCEAARSAPGVGLGLALSRALARDGGGDLRLEQTSSAGTTFLLRLPALG